MLSSVKRLVVRTGADFLRRQGYYVAEPHFSNPIPDKKYILSHDGYWKRPYPFHGIEFHDDEQIFLCEQLSKYAPEISGLPEDVLDPGKNRSFLDMDLEFLYCMIRVLKPKHFIEIGAGWSSLIAMHALAHNREEGYRCEHTIIEPYPGRYFYRVFQQADTFIEKPIQEVPEEIFGKLGKNDILFIDTSHIAKYGSDVNYIYFYIVPTVQKGSFIHIHDIFLPSDYFEAWVCENDIFYSEQYLVTAFLMYNNDYKIRIAAQYLSQKHRDKLNGLFPRFKPYFSPGSLWLERK